MTTLATYSDLTDAISSFLNREDLDDQVANFVALAEGTLNKVIRSPWMVADATLTTSAYRVSMPSDLMEPIYLQVATDTTYPLEQVDPEQLIELRRSRMRTSATPRAFAVIGRYFHLAPSPATSTSIMVSYYQQIPDLETNTTNWLLSNHPDLYLYTALMHAATFLKDTARLQLYTGFVSQQISDAVRQNELVAMDGVKVPGAFMQAVSDAAGAMQSPRVAPGAVRG